jgi:hypothetical protein
MALAPELDTAHLVGTAEVIAVGGFAQPTPLTGGLAGLPTRGRRTVVLAGFVARIGNEKLGATAAFASGLLAAHREPHHAERLRGRKLKRIPEEDETRRRKKRFRVKGWKKTLRKKTEFQTARFRPLSFRRWHKQHFRAKWRVTVA